MKKPTPSKSIAVGPKDLPLACPTAATNGGEPLWSQHPKVYLEFSSKGEACCPYCGTIYHWTGPLPFSTHH